MDNSGADHNLLFGLLALQNGLIDQSQLVAAFQSWTRQKDRPLAEHLVGSSASMRQRGVVEAMVGLHVQKHGGSTAKSLAALPGSLLTQRDLARLDDPDVAASLAGLPGMGTGLESARLRTLEFDLGSADLGGGALAGPAAEMRTIISTVDRARRTTPRRLWVPTAAKGSLAPWGEPGGTSSSTRSPAAGWGWCSGAATQNWAVSWP